MVIYTMNMPNITLYMSQDYQDQLASIAKKEHRGFILVVVLCMVIMLGILLFGFNHKSRAGLLAVDDLR